MGSLGLFFTITKILASSVALPSRATEAIVYMLYKTPSLKTKCFVLIAAVAFIDVFYSIQYMTEAVFSLRVSSNIVTGFTTTTSCIFIYLMFYTACNVLICALACDRLFAFLLPVRYFHASMRGTKHNFIICA